LNPLTSSDSPSAKSKGARLHSAIVEIIHTTKIGKVKNSILILYIRAPLILKLLIRETTLKIISEREISYLIDCEQDRIEPIILNLLLDNHPINNVLNTEIPINTINRISEKELLLLLNFIGRSVQNINMIKIEMSGANLNII